MSDAPTRRRSSLCLSTRMFFCSVVSSTTALRLRWAFSPVSEYPSAKATKATANRRHRHIFCILSATCEIMEEVGVLSSRTHDLCTAYDFSLFGDIMFSSSAAYIHCSANDVCYSVPHVVILHTYTSHQVFFSEQQFDVQVTVRRH